MNSVIRIHIDKNHLFVERNIMIGRGKSETGWHDGSNVYSILPIRNNYDFSHTSPKRTKAGKEIIGRFPIIMELLS